MATSIVLTKPQNSRTASAPQRALMNVVVESTHLNKSNISHDNLSCQSHVRKKRSTTSRRLRTKWFIQRETSQIVLRTGAHKGLVGWSRLLLQFHLGSLLLTLASGVEVLHYQQQSSQYQPESNSIQVFHQPALIGFRCESVRDITPGGVSVIEANSPVTITLFGDSFSTNTIVAFTTEFHSISRQSPALSTHFTDETKSSELVFSTVKPSTTTVTTQTTTTSTTVTPFMLSQVNAETTTLIAAPENNQSSKLTRFIGRRRDPNQSYDCTDYDRVTSYRLTQENIISPNVAQLKVTLPELDSGSYYYFCLKQPPLGSEGQETNESLVWVHQGDEWWLTLKVEPPILSVTNDCVLIVLLLFLSAVTSGLNLGLMSLDMNELAVISSCGDPRERSYARTIAPLRKRGNYLLCSLLLGNVMVNSTLTVILEEMTSGVVAVIGSTLAIVILGEIVPQAFCARQGLAIGARTIYLTYAFMLITFPLSYPISCLLDYVLGEEKGNVYDRERLMEFIRITGHHTQLEADEVAIISGALKLKKIKVDQIMTRIEDVFMLPIDCKLDRDTIQRIIEKGYSRVPLYEFGDRKQIVALIFAKDLALIDPDDHTPIVDMLMYCKHPLIFLEDDATLDVALNEFKTGKSHMAVVRQIYDDGETDKYYEAIGVVTLEDVIEEVLQAEINDETDTLSDNRRKRRRTDAQVAHFIDEQSRHSLSTTPIIDCDLSSQSMGLFEPAALSKQVQTSLSNQLTSVSIGEVAHSLNNGGSRNWLHAHPSSQAVELSPSSQQESNCDEPRVSLDQQRQQPDESEMGMLSWTGKFYKFIFMR